MILIPNKILEKIEIAKKIIKRRRILRRKNTNLGVILILFYNTGVSFSIFTFIFLKSTW